jgi:propanol-preferring alcohol dehydrogenase
MHAMVLTAPGAPLQFQQRNDPTPGPGAVRIAIGACGVCRTDLHVVDGELPGISYPIVPGHEVVGRAEALGPGVTAVKIGDRVGVPWLGYTCGECAYCRSGQENLCDRPLFTGYTRDGGFATHLVADARYCFPLGEAGDAAAIAPLLCTGLIGWRSLVMAGDGRHLGIYGFGCRRAYHRPGGALAGTLGLCIHAQGRCRGAETSAIPRHGLAEGSDELPPVLLDAAMIYAPVGALVPTALRAVRKGGRVVCAGIHMSDIPSFPYNILWEERQLVSVANLTRSDGMEFFAISRPKRASRHIRPSFRCGRPTRCCRSCGRDRSPALPCCGHETRHAGCDAGRSLEAGDLGDRRNRLACDRCFAKPQRHAAPEHGLAFRSWPDLARWPMMRIRQTSTSGKRKPAHRRRKLVPTAARLDCATAFQKIARDCAAGKALQRVLGDLRDLERFGRLGAISAPSKDGGQSDHRPPGYKGQKKKLLAAALEAYRSLKQADAR